MPSSENEKKVQKLKRDLREALGRTVPKPIWDRLVEERHVALVLDPKEDEGVEYLVQHAECLLKIHDEAAGADSPAFLRRQRRTKGVSLWQEALSEVMAAQARDWPEVCGFRRSPFGLGGKLLHRGKVEDWIITTEVRDARGSGGLKTPKGAEFDYIKYLRPGGKLIAARSVGQRGTVRKLHDLCRRLSTAFDWLDYQSTMFVLTDQVPVISSLRYNAERRRLYSTLSRIVLKVNLSMTPRELYEEYIKIRKRVLGDRKLTTIREKQAELAIFVARIKRSETTKEDMKKWNRLHPAWAYRRFSLFQRDWRRAHEKLTGWDPVLPDPVKELFGVQDGPG